MRGTWYHSLGGHLSPGLPATPSPCAYDLLVIPSLSVSITPSRTPHTVVSPSCRIRHTPICSTACSIARQAAWGVVHPPGALGRRCGVCCAV